MSVHKDVQLFAVPQLSVALYKMKSSNNPNITAPVFSSQLQHTVDSQTYFDSKGEA
jgi:pantothenate kinase